MYVTNKIKMILIHLVKILLDFLPSSTFLFLNFLKQHNIIFISLKKKNLSTFDSSTFFPEQIQACLFPKRKIQLIR